MGKFPLFASSYSTVVCGMSADWRVTKQSITIALIFSHLQTHFDTSEANNFCKYCGKWKKLWANFFFCHNDFNQNNNYAFVNREMFSKVVCSRFFVCEKGLMYIHVFCYRLKSWRPVQYRGRMFTVSLSSYTQSC